MQELDVVKLTRGIPAMRLRKGATGTIVWRPWKHECLVEFTTARGMTVGIESVPRDALQVIWRINRSNGQRHNGKA